MLRTLDHQLLQYLNNLIFQDPRLLAVAAATQHLMQNGAGRNGETPLPPTPFLGGPSHPHSLVANPHNPFPNVWPGHPAAVSTASDWFKLYASGVKDGAV